MEQESVKPFAAALAGMVIISLLIALLIIPFPFVGDQALYVVFARMMNDGSVLYSDVWDVKQPGIFWFYSAVGAVAGFNELAIHSAEAVYWILGSILVALGLRRFVRKQWVAALFLVFGPAFYFAAGTTNDFAQVEPLISLLIAGVVVLVALAMDRPDSSRILMMVTGVLAGVVGVFKLLALIIPLTIVLTAGVLRWRRGEMTKGVVTGSLVPFGLGALVPLLLLAAWVLLSDLTSEVWFTWVEYPPEMLSLEERPVSRLLRSTFSFGVVFASAGALGVYRLFKGNQRGRTLSMLALAALIASCVYILLQLWWNVHFFVLVAPLGILAVQGADDLFESRRRVQIIGLVVALTLSVPLALSIVDKSAAFTELIGSRDLTEYQSGIDKRFETALQVAAPLNTAPGAQVYVIGIPLILYVLEADQSIPINGWSPEFWTPEMWERVIVDLEEGDTEFVFFSDSARDLAEERSPWFEDRLLASFSPLHEQSSGIWLIAADQ